MLPTLTRQEREIIARCNTPEKTQRFIDRLPYNWEKGGKPTLRSFRRVVRDRTAHCLEGALTAAAILRLHGHAPLLLCMEARDIDHNLFVYRHGRGKGRCWGSISKSRDPNLGGRDPIYPTLWDLAMSYYPHYWNYFTKDHSDITLRGYALVRLGRFRQNWLTAEEDLTYIEDHLWTIPYRALEPRNRRRMFLSSKKGKLTWL